MQMCGGIRMADGYGVRHDRAQRVGDLFRASIARAGRKSTAEPSPQVPRAFCPSRAWSARIADNLSRLDDQSRIEFIAFLGMSEKLGFEQSKPRRDRRSELRLAESENQGERRLLRAE